MRADLRYTRKVLDIATAAVSSITSTTGIFQMGNNTRMSYRSEWGVNLTGTFALYEQASVGADWVENKTPLFKNPAKAAGNDSIEMYDMNAASYALRFTRTSGTTGPLEVWVYLKS